MGVVLEAVRRYQRAKVRALRVRWLRRAALLRRALWIASRILAIWGAAVLACGLALLVLVLLLVR